MKSLVAVSNTNNVIVQFEKTSRVVQDRLGMHPELIEALKIYYALIEVRRKLKASEDLLKTDVNNIK